MSAELVAIVKDEGPFLLEWIAYHKVAGFSSITLYDNGSTDSTASLLSPLMNAGEIAVREWPDVPGVAPQRAAYADAVQRAQHEWVAFLDADEFLNLARHGTVGEWLDSFPQDTSAIGINWRVFGSAGLEAYSPELVIERFTRAAPREHNLNLHLKTFVRPKQVELVHIHYCLIKEGVYRNADGDPLEMTRKSFSNVVTHKTAQINHYCLKSYEEYRWKIARGNANRAPGPKKNSGRDSPDYWEKLDRNEELDESILRFLSGVKSEMLRLATIAGVR